MMSSATKEDLGPLMDIKKQQQHLLPVIANQCKLPSSPPPPSVVLVKDDDDKDSVVGLSSFTSDDELEEEEDDDDCCLCCCSGLIHQDDHNEDRKEILNRFLSNRGRYRIFRNINNNPPQNHWNLSCLLKQNRRNNVGSLLKNPHRHRSSHPHHRQHHHHRSRSCHSLQSSSSEEWFGPARSSPDSELALSPCPQASPTPSVPSSLPPPHVAINAALKESFTAKNVVQLRPLPVQPSSGSAGSSSPSSSQAGTIPLVKPIDVANKQFICNYRSTLASIREAVSHLTRLDDFNVVNLSHGFFSQVFKVKHFATKKVMVLKMNKEAGNRANARREIELLNKLNHPNIVGFMGTVVHEGGLHPLLEYINGGTLEQLIRQFYSRETLEQLNASTGGGNGKCSSPPAPSSRQFVIPIRKGIISPKVHVLQNPDRVFLKLMRDVSAGMAYLHSFHHLHRDLASKNVFIRKLPLKVNSDDGRPSSSTGDSSKSAKQSASAQTGDYVSMQSKNIDAYLDNYWDDDRLEAVIGDFGFAIGEPTRDQKLDTVGSPYWLAPECLKNRWYNHKCDIYSFGIICCELNWRIPADPDFLPRIEVDDSFTIDFGRLMANPQYCDTPLASLVYETCQNDPNLRPEFSEITARLEYELEGDHARSTNSSAAASSKQGLSDVEYDDEDEVDSVIASDNYTDDGSGSGSIGTMGRARSGHHSEHQDNTSYCNSVSIAHWISEEQHPFHEHFDGDIFDQHLLRRRYSSFSAN